MAVGEADNLPHVEAHVIGDHRQLVGKGDIDVAEGVLDQLAHLGAARVGGDAGAAHEALVEGERLSCAPRGDAADRAVVVGELFKNAPREDALRAIGDRDIGRLACKPWELEIRT